ncbi:MAG: hypothetical protein ACE5FS_10925 [Paracoccaceae bacterium]
MTSNTSRIVRTRADGSIDTAYYMTAARAARSRQAYRLEGEARRFAMRRLGAAVTALAAAVRGRARVALRGS